MSEVGDNASLRMFFLDLQISVERIDEYVANLSLMGVKNESDLRGFASIWNLEKVGMCDIDIQHVMQLLFANIRVNQGSTNKKYRAEDQGGGVDGIQSEPYSVETSIASKTPLRLTKNAVITFQEIGRGASGRVSKALFAPSLTLVAIKRIEIKDALTRKVVGQELKFLYEVAQSQLILSSPLNESTKTTSEDPKLSLLSGQLYSDVIAGCHTLPSPSSTSDREPKKTKPKEVVTANCPYIISFYDAYIDPEYGAVCLVLEYMNAGSIQNMLTDGKKFDEDDAAVLAFSVLNALIELHSRNILHRDIKPSNILTDCAGRIKLTDFGITKEMLEENKCADSFIGTLAYMSPDRVRGIPYSFEADMWSLGITMITIIAGKPPFPTNRGPWHLMNAIIQGPQPFLDPAIVSHDLRSFIHDCLNQPPQVSTCAVKLLEHDFLTSAKKRGVITTPAFLPIPGLLMHCSDPTAEVIDKIVEAAISWQLECFEDQKIFQFTAKKNDARGDKIEEPIVYSKMPRYSVEKIRGLAAQMLIDNTILEEKFDAKYTQIDALFVEGWSIEGLVKVVWPSKPKGDKFAVSKNATTVRTEVFRGTNTLPIVGDADVTLQKTHRIQR